MEKDSPPISLEYAAPASPVQTSETKLENLLAQFSSPSSRLMVFQGAGIAALVGLVWIILSLFFSLLNIWVFILLMIGLAVYVKLRERKQEQREWWILQGQCADCGYDLDAKPIACPHCGRDASQDEPTWRKTRRQLEAKLLADAAGEPLALKSKLD